MNTKKHTMRKKRLMILGVIIPSLILFGCIRSISPPVAIPVAPIKQESVVPHLNKVNGGIDATIKSNSKLEQKIKEQKKELTDQQFAIIEAITQAEKLKSQLLSKNCISEIEALLYIDNMKKIEARNLFIEKQNAELEAIRKEQEAILKMTKEDASITYRKLLDKESEAMALREQNDYLGSNLKLKNEEIQKLQKDIENEKIKSAKSGVYKNWVIGLVSIFIAWLIIKNILMIYFPMTKFRI